MEFLTFVSDFSYFLMTAVRSVHGFLVNLCWHKRAFVSVFKSILDSHTFAKVHFVFRNSEPPKSNSFDLSLVFPDRFPPPFFSLVFQFVFRFLKRLFSIHLLRALSARAWKRKECSVTYTLKMNWSWRKSLNQRSVVQAFQQEAHLEKRPGKTKDYVNVSNTTFSEIDLMFI